MLLILLLLLLLLSSSSLFSPHYWAKESKMEEGCKIYGRDEI
jgi:hypothetical protein